MDQLFQLQSAQSTLGLIRDASEGGVSRTFTIEEVKTSSIAALNLCERASQYLAGVDPKAGRKLEGEVTNARTQLDQNKSSPVNLGVWYKSEMLAVFDEAEILLRDMQGPKV